MSGHGAPTMAIEGADGLRAAVVASSWHTEVMDGLLAGAVTTLAEAGIEAEVVRVAGSFELPVVAAQLARTHDLVVALGVIIRGGTPVGFGLLTCDDDQQALDRAGLPGSTEDKGREAAEAALATAVTLRRLRA